MLTDKEIAALKPTDRPYKRFDSGGLYVEVSPAGSISWRFRYSFAGEGAVLTFGRWPKLSIVNARRKQAQIQQLIIEGVDPRDEVRREHAATAHTFEAEAAAWITLQASGWTERYTKQVERALLGEDVSRFKVRGGRREFGRLHMNEIDAADVMEIQQAIEARGALDVAADTNMWIGKVFLHCIPLGRAKRNPAADCKGALAKRTRTNFAALDFAGLPEMFRRLRASPFDEQTQLGLRLKIRLCTRTVELTEALWSELDHDRRLLVISQQRMKDERANRKAHGPYLVPLAPSSLSLLESLRALTGHSQYLFPGRDGPHTTISNGTWLMALKRLGYKNQATVHGFRSTFSTYFNTIDTRRWEKIVDRQLDHVPRNKTSAAYNRAQYLPERTTLMNLWAVKIDEAEREAGYTDLPAPEKKRNGNALDPLRYVVIDDGTMRYPVSVVNILQAGKMLPDLRSMDAQQLSDWREEVQICRVHGEVGSQGSTDFCDDLAAAGAAVWKVSL